MLHQDRKSGIFGGRVQQKEQGEKEKAENDAFATISASRYSRSSQSIRALNSECSLSAPQTTDDTNARSNERPEASGSLPHRASISSQSTRMMKSEFLELRRRSATFRKIIEKDNQENHNPNFPSWAGSTPPLSAMLGKGKLALRGGVGGVLQESKGIPKRPALRNIDWNLKTPGNPNSNNNNNNVDADSPLSLSDTNHDSNNDRDRDGSSSPESVASGMRSHTSTELTEPSPRSLMSNKPSLSKSNLGLERIQQYLNDPQGSPIEGSLSMEEEEMMMMELELDENMLVYCSPSEFLPTMVSTPPPVAQRVNGKGRVMMELAATPLSMVTAAKMARNRLGSIPFGDEKGLQRGGSLGVQRLARFEGGKAGLAAGLLGDDVERERYQVYFGVGGGISPGIGGGKFGWESEEEGIEMKSVVVE